MKSEPGWSAVKTSTVVAGSFSCAATGAVAERVGSIGDCAGAGSGCVAATNAAAPPAVPFKKLRRANPDLSFELAKGPHSLTHFTCVSC